MSILEIKKFPDPVLQKPCAEVTSFDSELAKLLDDMADTMYQAQGVGLASSQVGILKRVAVIDVSEEKNSRIDLVNPVIVKAEGSTSSEEGCLSIPGYRDSLKRKKALTLKAHDRHGKPFELTADGLLAICIQHEIDHLDGVLFIDRLSRLKKELFKRWLKKQIEG